MQAMSSLKFIAGRSTRTVAADVVFAAAVLVCLVLLPVQARAQQAAGLAGLPSSLSVISDTALSNATGHVGFNSTAGQSNAQSNATAIAIGSNGIVGTDLIGEHQVVVPVGGVRGTEDVVIRDDAFRASRGVVSVNQSSGSGNAQTNLVMVGIGGRSEVTLDQLLQVTAQAPVDPSDGATPGPVRRTEIADSAFVGSRGIVQVNQSAGLGNRTANVFALSVSAAVP